jgi:phosphopantetheine--protein transferase-like protein
MIIGVGIDLVRIEKVAALWKNHNERLRETIFTPAELQNIFHVKKLPEQFGQELKESQLKYLSVYFASKEAVIKILGFNTSVKYELNNIEATGDHVLSIKLNGPLIHSAEEKGISKFIGSWSYTKYLAAVCIIGEK